MIDKEYMCLFVKTYIRRVLTITKYAHPMVTMSIRLEYYYDHVSQK